MHYIVLLKQVAVVLIISNVCFRHRNGMLSEKSIQVQHKVSIQQNTGFIFLIRCLDKDSVKSGIPIGSWKVPGNNPADGEGIVPVRKRCGASARSDMYVLIWTTLPVHWKNVVCRWSILPLLGKSQLGANCSDSLRMFLCTNGFSLPYWHTR